MLHKLRFIQLLKLIVQIMNAMKIALGQTFKKYQRPCKPYQSQTNHFRMFVRLKNSNWVNARHIFIFLVYDFQLNALSNSDLKLEEGVHHDRKHQNCYYEAVKSFLL